MAVKRNITALVPFSWSDSVQATSALLVASTAFGFYTLSRLVAARAAEAAIQELFRWASNPVEALILAVAGFSLLYYGSGYGRAAQLLTASQLRALILPSFSASAQPSERNTFEPVEPCSPTSSPTSSSSTSSSRRSSISKGSPNKDFAAHRLAERRSRSFKHRHRWSIDVAPTSGPRQDFVLPRQRATSAERVLQSSTPSHAPTSAPATPRAQHEAQQECGVSSPSASTEPAAEFCMRGRCRRVQAAMQRITSGQELVELGRPSRRSLEKSRLRLASGSCPPAPARHISDAGASRDGNVSLPAKALASAQPVSHPLHRLTTTEEVSLTLVEGQAGSSPLASAPTAAESLQQGILLALPSSAGSVSERTLGGGTASACYTVETLLMSDQLEGTGHHAGTLACSRHKHEQQDQQQTQQKDTQPESPSKSVAATAMGSWVYSAVAPLSDWAASTVSDWAGSLQRTHSAPVPRNSAATTAEELKDSANSGDVQSGAARRRSSLDGAGRCYTWGQVVADPARTGELERYARCARSASPAGVVAVPGDPPSQGTALSQHDDAVTAALLGGDDAARTSALASVGLDGPCPPEVRRVVTDEHLLQFAALIGDDVALKVNAQLGIPSPWGSQDSLFGGGDSAAGAAAAATGAAPHEEGWESVVKESAAGLHYQAWRKELRGGLYVYRARAVFEGVMPQQLRFFHLDDEIKSRWDDTSLGVERVAPAGAQRADPASEWCLHRYRSRFPMPMAARLYSYARRVWHRPSDGGCYMVCRYTDLPPGSTEARAVQVKDFVSCAVVRQVEGGTELATAYFEDSQVRPSLVKVAIPRGLWGYMLKYDAALRACLEMADLPGRRRSLEGSRPSRLGCGTATGGGPIAKVGPSQGVLGRGRVGSFGQLGSVWRGGRWSQRAVNPRSRVHPSSRTLLRNMVLATGITVLYDIMRR